jgi:hypothetical protein
LKVKAKHAKPNLWTHVLKAVKLRKPEDRIIFYINTHGRKNTLTNIKVLFAGAEVEFKVSLSLPLSLSLLVLVDYLLVLFRPLLKA